MVIIIIRLSRQPFKSRCGFKSRLSPDVCESSNIQPATQSYKVKSQPGFLCYQVDEGKPQVNSGRTENTAGLETLEDWSLVRLESLFPVIVLRVCGGT